MYKVTFTPSLTQLVRYPSLMAQQVMNPPAVQEIQETWVQSLDQEDPLEKENGNPLQYSCLEKSHGQKRLVVQGIAKSQTQPSD